MKGNESSDGNEGNEGDDKNTRMLITDRQEVPKIVNSSMAPHKKIGSD